MLTTLAKNETVLLIDGPTGKLELAVTDVNEKYKPWAVICHPHPLYGGTMDNKVVTTLAKTFQGLGAGSIRFNFRGVGRSDGTFDYGQGEVDDLKAVVAWLKTLHPQLEVWLGGFSFGGAIAAIGATQIPEVTKLVTIAPGVSHVSMKDLPPITCKWVLVQGEQDDVVPPKEVFEWAKSRDPKPEIIRFPEAGHFFHGQLGELRLRLEEALA